MKFFYQNYLRDEKDNILLQNHLYLKFYFLRRSVICPVRCYFIDFINLQVCLFYERNFKIFPILRANIHELNGIEYFLFT